MPENPLPQRDEKPLGPSNWVRDLVKDNPLAPKPGTPGATPNDLKTPLPTPPAGVVTPAATTDAAPASTATPPPVAK